jgi:hypothetical protein
MSRDTTVLPFRQREAIDDPLSEVAREGAPDRSGISGRTIGSPDHAVFGRGEALKALPRFWPS